MRHLIRSVILFGTFLWQKKNRNAHDTTAYLSICIFVWVLIKFDCFIIIEQYVTNCMRSEKPPKQCWKIIIPGSAHFTAHPDEMVSVYWENCLQQKLILISLNVTQKTPSPTLAKSLHCLWWLLWNVTPSYLLIEPSIWAILNTKTSYKKNCDPCNFRQWTGVRTIILLIVLRWDEINGFC